MLYSSRARTIFGCGLLTSLHTITLSAETFSHFPGNRTLTLPKHERPVMPMHNAIMMHASDPVVSNILWVLSKTIYVRLLPQYTK